jgi:hypothetical protein
MSQFCTYRHELSPKGNAVLHISGPTNCLHLHTIIIIIIIGKTSFFEPKPSLEDSARFFYSWRESDHPIFTFLDVATIIFYTQQGHQPCVQSSNLEDQVSVFTSPLGKVAQLYLHAPGSLFVASTHGLSQHILLILHAIYVSPMNSPCSNLTH